MGGNISKASDCCEVAEAHSSLGQAYEGYAKSVLENSVDGATLLTLKTREELCAFLEALGVANLVHRTVLAAHVLRAGETGSDVQPSQSAPGTVFAAPAPTVLVPEGTRRRIFRAAEEADMAVLRPLVEEWKRHADVVDWVNPDSPFGYTPLLAACDAGATEAVRLLVMAPAVDVNRETSDGSCTALLLAVQRGHIGVMRVLLAAPGLEANLKVAKGGRTALMAAAGECGRIDNVLVLLARAVEVNAVDDEGWTALMGAAHHGHPDIVRVLMAVHGIDLNKADKTGCTALALASREAEGQAESADTRERKAQVAAMLRASGAR